MTFVDVKGDDENWTRNLKIRNPFFSDSVTSSSMSPCADKTLEDKNTTRIFLLVNDDQMTIIWRSGAKHDTVVAMIARIRIE